MFACSLVCNASKLGIPCNRVFTPKAKIMQDVILCQVTWIMDSYKQKFQLALGILWGTLSNKSISVEIWLRFSRHSHLQFIQNSAVRLENMIWRPYTGPLLLLKLILRSYWLLTKPWEALLQVTIFLWLPYVPSCTLRSSDASFFVVSRSRLIHKGDKAFAVGAPRLWYDLSEEVRVANSVSVLNQFWKPTFLKLLKTVFWKVLYK